MGEEVEIFSNKEEVPGEAFFESAYSLQIEELAEIRNPSTDLEYLSEKIKELKSIVQPVYIFFPWRNLVLESVPEEIFFELKTNRNQLLITKEEQHKLYFNTKISIAGMSVGSSLLYGLIGTAIAREIIISDYDNFSTSNLNRVQATILDVGKNKAAAAKQRALELNPFLKITIIEDPIQKSNITDFITDKTNIIFEEIDDFKMKVELRKFAKEQKKAYVMLTNLGDGVLIDIERHDIEETKIFNGTVGEDVLDKIKQVDKPNPELMKELSVSLVDTEMISERAMQTLDQIGKTLVGRPQLYSTVALDGGIAPYIARRVINGPELRSGRYKLDLNKSM